MKRLLCVCCLLTVFVPVLRAAEKPKVEFRDGDRIVFLGNEFFERDQERGYIETALTTRFPDKNLTFRNLGYSGDTVRADARNLCAGWENFGPADQGFGRLKSLLEHIKPTLVFVAYGMNESFDGEKGLPSFVQDLNTMLDMLSSGGARIVLVSPIRHEDLGRPLPDPTEHNKNLRIYIDAMQKVAKQHSTAFVNLFTALGEKPGTFDGIHLTPYGYWRAAMTLEAECGYSSRTVKIDIDAKNASANVTGSKVSDVKAGPQSVQFTVMDEMLPQASLPLDSADAVRSLSTSPPPNPQFTLRVTGLAPGNYTLKLDDQPIESASAKDWETGNAIYGPEGKQVEQLRKLIVAKNFDFFNFWRPDNDTYIFGYRKHEQGRNAVEIPRFEPLVEAKEAEISKLRVPVSHTFVLAPDAGK